MSTQRRQEHAATHGPINNQQPHQSEQVDSRTTSESASDVEDVWNSVAHLSLIPATGHALASTVELWPWENLDSLAEMTTIMQDQAAHIQELE